MDLLRAYDFVREHREIKAAVLEYRWAGHAIYEEDWFKFESYQDDLDQEYSFVGYRTRLLQFLDSYAVWDDELDVSMIDEFGILRCQKTTEGESCLNWDFVDKSRPGPEGDIVDNADGDIERLIWHRLMVREARGESVDVDHTFKMAGLR